MQKSDAEDKLLTDSTANTPAPQVVRPWVRFWARMIDYGIFGLLAGVVLLFALEFSTINLVLLLITAYLVFEAVMLSIFGTTPGKMLAGIRLRCENGAKMNLPNALIRSFEVWWRGEGLGIPIVSLTTNILAFHSLKKGGRTAWDQRGKIIVFQHPIGWGRISAMIILLVAIYGYGAVQFWPPLLSGVKILWNRNAAKCGDAEAQFELGKCYYIGDEKPEVSKDKWWLKAAEQPWIFPVQNNIWCAYKRYGRVTKNNAEAAKWFRKAAAQGYAKAEYMLGICYAEYYGPDFDYKVAKNWWLKAAKQGYADAQYILGASYDCGFRKEESINMLKLSNNMLERAKWWRKAAEQGHAEAQRGLGTCYLRGEGVAKDETKAVEWYRKAAAQTNAQAQGQLGNCYTYARGVARNEAEAAKWYRLAVKNGSQSAETGLEELNKYIEFRKAAETGDAKALNELGLCYNYGSGVNSNVSEALRLYRQAAERGYMDAQYILGECYYNGYRGFKKDKTEAAKWWRKAAEPKPEESVDALQKAFRYYHEGRVKSQYELARCYASGEGVAKDEAEAARWRLKADTYTKSKKNTP